MATRTIDYDPAREYRGPSRSELDELAEDELAEAVCRACGGDDLASVEVRRAWQRVRLCPVSEPDGWDVEDYGDDVGDESSETVGWVCVDCERECELRDELVQPRGSWLRLPPVLWSVPLTISRYTYGPREERRPPVRDTRPGGLRYVLARTAAEARTIATKAGPSVLIAGWETSYPQVSVLYTADEPSLAADQDALCGGCQHTGHWRECRADGCYCRRRGPGGQRAEAVGL